MSYVLSNTLLFVENLTVSYGERVIIKDVQFTEKDVLHKDGIKGQVVAFIGRSGRGKSTLFKALSGLVKPKLGRVLIIDKNDPTGKKAKEVQEGDVGFVDQKYTLFRNKTIEQALNFALRKRNLNESEKKELIHSFLNDWGLLPFKDKYPCELSGGQRQRTAIIEQLLCSEHYIILDEPFSGLDVGNIEDVKKSFHRIVSSHELNTILFSTHDIELAVELADSIYVIGYPEVNGEKKEYGTIVHHIDMKELGLAWKKFNVDHLEVVQRLKQIMLKS